MQKEGEFSICFHAFPTQATHILVHLWVGVMREVHDDLEKGDEVNLMPD